MCGRQGSDHVARVLFAFDLLGLRHHTAQVAPAVVGLVEELREDASWLAGLAVKGGGLLHGGLDDPP